jgi:hypothetical protein
MATTVACVVGASAFAAPAAAWTTYEVTETHRSHGVVNMNDMLASCSGTPGTTCTIRQSEQAERVISLSLGASRSVVAGELNISRATSRTVAVSCSATITSNRRVLRAYPTGTQIFYKITRNHNGTKTTSGTMMAFEPNSSSQYCTHLRG